MQEIAQVRPFGNYVRFMLPGVCSVIVLLVSLWVSDRDTLLSWLSCASQQGNAGLLAAFAGVFLGSGAVGYLLANVYFAVYNSRLMDPAGLDYRQLLEELGDHLVFRDVRGKETSFAELKLTRRQAWNVVCSFWYSRLEHSKSLKGLNRMTDRLTDSMHSLGATAVGVFVAAAVWLSIHTTSSPWPPHSLADHWAPLALHVALLFFLTRAYAQARHALQAMVDSEVARRVNGTRERTSAPVALFWVE